MVGNVPLDAKIEYRKILNRVLLRVNAADHGKTLALMDVVGDAVKGGSQGREGEVVWVDKIAVKAQGCFGEKCQRSDRLKRDRGRHTFEVLQRSRQLMEVCVGEVVRVLRLLGELRAGPG